MSYKSEFASNNAELQTILDKVNTLPAPQEIPELYVVNVRWSAGGMPLAYRQEALYKTVKNGEIIDALMLGQSTCTSMSFFVIPGSEVTVRYYSTAKSFAYSATKNAAVTSQTNLQIVFTANGDCEIHAEATDIPVSDWGYVFFE